MRDAAAGEGLRPPARQTTRWVSLMCRTGARITCVVTGSLTEQIGTYTRSGLAAKEAPYRDHRQWLRLSAVVSIVVPVPELAPAVTPGVDMRFSCRHSGGRQLASR